MAQGDIYRALSANQNLKPAIEAIQGMVQNNRRKQAITEIAKAKMQMDNLQSVPDNLPIGGNSIIPGLMNPNIQDAKYNQAQIIANDAMWKGTENGLSKEDLGIYGGLLGEQAKMMKKKPLELFSTDPKNNVYDKTTGKLFQEGKEKTTASKETPYQYTEDYLKLKQKYDNKENNGLSNSESLSREKFEYTKKKDAKKESVEKREKQSAYNKIMASTYYTVDELRAMGVPDETLLSRGILREKDGEFFKNTGGAYAYESKAGNELFATDKELEEFAKSQVANVPNKWGRPEEKGKFVEGKVYVDANGNKAKYVNGKWETIN